MKANEENIIYKYQPQQKHIKIAYKYTLDIYKNYKIINIGKIIITLTSLLVNRDTKAFSSVFHFSLPNVSILCPAPANVPFSSSHLALCLL